MKLSKNDLKELDNIEHLYLSEIVPFGNGAKIAGSKKYIGQQCVVAVLMKDPRLKKQKPKSEETK